MSSLGVAAIKCLNCYKIDLFEGCQMATLANINSSCWNYVSLLMDSVCSLMDICIAAYLPSGRYPLVRDKDICLVVNRLCFVRWVKMMSHLTATPSPPRRWLWVGGQFSGMGCKQ